MVSLPCSPLKPTGRKRNQSKKIKESLQTEEMEQRTAGGNNAIVKAQSKGSRTNKQKIANSELLAKIAASDEAVKEADRKQKQKEVNIYMLLLVKET